jgi:hypothetical protein
MRWRACTGKVEEADELSGGTAGEADIALTYSMSEASAVGERSSSVRKGRILGRYVFRDELGPGESWKRRIETRRERRGWARLIAQAFAPMFATLSGAFIALLKPTTY